MKETYVTVVGNVVNEPEQRVARNGSPFTTFRLASTERRFNAAKQAYEDGPTSFYYVACWRTLAFNTVASVHKGQPVVVHGRQRVNQWQASNGSFGTSVEIEAMSIGHDLCLGRATFEKVARSSSTDGDERMGDQEVQASLHRDDVGAVTVPDDASALAPESAASDLAASALAAPDLSDYEVEGDDGQRLRLDRTTGELVGERTD